MKKKFTIALTAVAVCYVLITWTGCAMQQQIVWPMSAEEPVDRPVPRGAELVWMENKDGSRIEGWLFRPPPETQAPVPSVIFFHGNNEVIDHCLEFAERYPANGYALLLVEYRGYGRSTGSPAREPIRQDMMLFYDWLAAREGIDPDRIAFHGRSIGGAVAVDLAEHREPAALILTSTFTSMEVMFWRYGVPGVIVQDKYRTEDTLKRLGVPTLVMHGARDNIIPVEDGRELGTLGPHTTYVEWDANHDLPTDWPPFEKELITFLGQHLPGDARNTQP